MSPVGEPCRGDVGPALQIRGWCAGHKTRGAQSTECDWGASSPGVGAGQGLGLSLEAHCPQPPWQLACEEGGKPVGLRFHYLGQSQGLYFLLVPSPAYGFVQRPCPGPRAPPVLTHNPALHKPEALENAHVDDIFLANSSQNPIRGRNAPCSAAACSSHGSQGHKLVRALGQSQPWVPGREGQHPAPTPIRSQFINWLQRLAHAQSPGTCSGRHRTLVKATNQTIEGVVTPCGLFWQAGGALGISGARIHVVGLGSQTW